METPRKFILITIITDEDSKLRIESFATINLRGVSTKLYSNLIFTMQTYKKLMHDIAGLFDRVHNLFAVHVHFRRIKNQTYQQ